MDSIKRRRFLVLLWLCLALCNLASAALPAATTWELRTAGNNNNGGCFVAGASGTDYSQQNAAQYTFTDLVLVTTTTVSSASHTFDANDIGNCLHITAGVNFTQGFYQIVSQAAGVATLDRAAGTMGSTGGTFAVGGAVAVPSTVTNNWTAGNTAYMKADGTYTVTTTAGIGTLTTPSVTTSFIGYNSTRTDCGHPTWTSATNSIHLVTFNSGGGSNDVGALVFKCITMTHTAGTRGNGFQITQANQDVARLLITDFTFDGMLSAVNLNAAANVSANLYRVEIKNSTGSGLTLVTNFLSCQYCYIHDNATDGAAVSASASFSWSVFADNGSDGVNFTWNSVGVNNFSNGTISGCAFYSNSSDGVEATGTNGTFFLTVVNTSFWDNTTFAINLSASPAGGPVGFNNAYVSGGLDNFPAGTGDVTLTASPYTNPAAANYSLNSTAGGGAALKAVGFPGVTPFGTGYLDIGPLQTQVPVTSGTRVYSSAN